MSITSHNKIEPGAGRSIDIAGLGVALKLSARDTNGSFSLVEHTLSPGMLGAPPHTHANEDEFSYVLEGELGMKIGDHEFQAGVGSYILKPRGLPHTFWNAGTQPVRFIEIISPAGFERYFDELAAVVNAWPVGGEPDFAALAKLASRYSLTFHMEQMPELLQKHNLRLG